eukprot:6492583-Amphidinium_carterae.6
MDKVYGVAGPQPEPGLEADSDEEEPLKDGVDEQEHDLDNTPLAALPSGPLAQLKAREEAFKPEFTTPKGAKLNKTKSKDVLSGASTSGKSKARDDMSSLDDGATLAGLDMASQAGTETGSVSGSLNVEKRVADMISKLDLVKVLEGKRLGVTKRHATELIPKLKEHERILMQNHLSLYDAAMKLSVDAIASHTEADIRQSVQTLESASIGCPTHVQRHIWKLHASRAMQGINSVAETVDERKLAQFWHLVRPHKFCSTMTQSFDMNTPTLSSIDETIDDKVKALLDQVLLQLLLPLVQRGEAAGKYVHLLAEAVKNHVDKDMEDEIEEQFLPCLVNMRQYLSGFIALMGKPFEQLENKDSILTMRQAHGSKSTDMCIIFSKAVLEVSWYKQMLDSFLADSLSMDVHRDAIQKCRGFWEGCQAFLWENLAFNDLVPGLKGVSALAQDVPETVMLPLLQTASLKTSTWWQSCLQVMQTDAEKCLEMQAEMQNFIKEACITFPLEQKWEDAQNQLNEVYAQAMCSKKCSGLVEAAEKLASVLDEASWVQSAQNLAHAVREARGVEVSHAMWQKLRPLLQQQLPQKLLGLLKARSTDAQLLVDIFVEFNGVGCKPFCPASLVDKFLHGSNLLQAYLACKEAELQKQTWDQPGAKDKLAELVRCIEKCNLAESGWGKDIIQNLLHEATTIQDKVKACWLEAGRKALADGVALLQPLAGGKTDGSLWKDSLSADAKWEDVVAQAKASIFTMTISRITSMRDHIEEARGTLSPQSARQSYHDMLGFFSENQADNEAINSAISMVRLTNCTLNEAMLITLLNTPPADKMKLRRGVLEISKKVDNLKLELPKFLLERVQKAKNMTL